MAASCGYVLELLFIVGVIWSDKRAVENIMDFRVRHYLCLVKACDFEWSFPWSLELACGRRVLFDVLHGEDLLVDGLQIEVLHDVVYGPDSLVFIWIR